MSRRSSVTLLVACAVVLTAGLAIAGDLPPGGTYTDDDGNVHEGSIEAIAAEAITKGCNPPTNDLFCPSGDVTRGQMAAFLVRALALTDGAGGDLFLDDDDSIFETDIDKLGTAGVTKGCNPPANDKFCPDATVTRGQMAAFLVRAFGYTDNGGGDLFGDDNASVFETDIDKLGTAGVTKGCNPPANDRYCPDSPVVRDQMATFLTRALELTPMTPPPRPQPFSDGVWVVGSEVAPALWRNSDSSGGCFWERLSGFSGELDDTITNEFTFSIQIVDIMPGDAGFASDRCGTWTKIG